MVVNALRSLGILGIGYSRFVFLFANLFAFVLQALALGARAVFIGRPMLWGLAHSGEEGVYNVLKLLNDELIMAMKLTGCVKISVSAFIFCWLLPLVHKMGSVFTYFVQFFNFLISGN